MTQGLFSTAARKASDVAGSPGFFVASVVAIAIWMVSGPYMGFNEAWNFWANTTTTLGTWVIVILIQNSQNRDTALIKALLQEIAEDLPQVDDRRAARRAEAGG